VDPKAKGEFLKKISINGFSIEEKDNLLVLRPRGSKEIAEVIIVEAEMNVWKVAGSKGAYAAFGHGRKRSFFESYINRWAMEAISQSEG